MNRRWFVIRALASLALLPGLKWIGTLLPPWAHWRGYDCVRAFHVRNAIWGESYDFISPMIFNYDPERMSCAIQSTWKLRGVEGIFDAKQEDTQEVVSEGSESVRHLPQDEEQGTGDCW